MFNRAQQTEWSHRRVFNSNTERANGFAPWLEFYSTQRRHSALGGLPQQPNATNLVAQNI
jgi:hypothetical protein